MSLSSFQFQPLLLIILPPARLKGLFRMRHFLLVKITCELHPPGYLSAIKLSKLSSGSLLFEGVYYYFLVLLCNSLFSTSFLKCTQENHVCHNKHLNNLPYASELPSTFPVAKPRHWISPESKDSHQDTSTYFAHRLNSHVSCMVNTHDFNIAATR